MRILLLVLACLVGLAAAAAVPAEFRAHLRSQTHPLDFYVFPDPGLGQPQRSVEAIYGGLMACDGALTESAARFMPGETVAQVAATCRAQAEGLLARAPTLAVAHLVRAEALALLGQPGEARAALAAAEATGGDITWMAERRFDLRAGPLWTEHATTQDALARDIARLAQSNDGRSGLAQRFRARPDLRDLVTATLETLPPEVQRLFLTALRRSGEAG